MNNKEDEIYEYLKITKLELICYLLSMGILLVIAIML